MVKAAVTEYYFAIVILLVLARFRGAGGTLKILNLLRLDRWIITGTEPAGKGELQLIFSGREVNKNLLVRLAFEVCHEKYVGKVWLWNIFKSLRQTDRKDPLLIGECPRPLRLIFRKKTRFFAPCWIFGEMDINCSAPSSSKNSSLDSDIRRIRSNNLTCELSNEERDCHMFYHHMYVPYISKTHRNEAVLISYANMSSKFKKCDLLFIKKDGECIAGILLAYSKRGARLWALGIKDGNRDYVHNGAIGALFYYSIEYLRGRGHRNVNLGASRPFLNDGILQFKNKWTPKSFKAGNWGFLIETSSENPAARNFLLSNPFVFMDGTRFNGALFVNSSELSSPDNWERIHRKYYLSGMHKLIVYAFSDGVNTRLKDVPKRFSDEITVCPVARLNK